MRRDDNLHVPAVWKYGSLSLLESSGPAQAYNGIALPSPFLSLPFPITHLCESGFS